MKEERETGGGKTKWRKGNRMRGGGLWQRWEEGKGKLKIWRRGEEETWMKRKRGGARRKKEEKKERDEDKKKEE